MRSILATEELYHIFNRGVEHRQIFLCKNNYKRAIETIKFYQYNPKLKFADFKNLTIGQREKILQEIHKLPKIVEIICYCLMPNHFHFLIKQLTDNGISIFISKFTNSYTKYFNTGNNRDGSLLGGTFKSVWVETQEQLLHLSRYIHLNPTTSYLVKAENLEDYQWSSFNEFMGLPGFCQKEIILSEFKSPQKYKEFVLDQADYARTLENIKHKFLEE